MAPDSIPPGSSYPKEIIKAIKNCTVCVLILSENAQNSKYVSTEIEQVFANEKTIIPFAIENCYINDEFTFFISKLQRIEAYEKKAQALEVLVNRIKALMKIDVENANPGDNNHPDTDEEYEVFDMEDDKAKTETVNDLQLAGGVLYTGETVNSKPNGKGKFVWTNGDIYEGDFAEGKRTGKVKYVWPSGNVYIGDTIDGKLTGKGRMVYKDGRILDGEFKDSKFIG